MTAAISSTCADSEGGSGGSRQNVRRGAGAGRQRGVAVAHAVDRRSERLDVADPGGGQDLVVGELAARQRDFSAGGQLRSLGEAVQRRAAKDRG